MSLLLLFIGVRTSKFCVIRTRTRCYELGLWRSDCRLWRATRENCHAFEDEEAHDLIFQTTTLIHKEALVTKTLQSPGSDFLTSSANISLHRDEHEVRGCSGFFLFIRHTTWSHYANYATSTKGLNQWKIKNVPVHSKLKEKSKKVFFFFFFFAQ